MVHHDLKVWAVLGLISFMMIVLLFATYGEGDKITGFVVADTTSIATSSFYWTMFFVVGVLAFLVFMKVEYGYDKRRFS